MHDLSIADFDRLLITKYTDVAALMLFLYDWCLTFSDEIQFIWKAQWSFPKLLFFLARYLALVCQVIQPFYTVGSSKWRSCLPILRVIIALSFIVFVVTECILLLRTLALYRGNRLVYRALVTLYGISATVSIVIISVWSGGIRIMPLPPIPGCGLAHGNGVVVVDLTLLVIWEIVIVSLALWKAWREHVSSGLSFLRILSKDGFHYYLYTFLSSVANVVISFLGVPELFGLLLSLERSAHSICSTRLLLHVRSQAQAPNNEDNPLIRLPTSLAPDPDKVPDLSEPNYHSKNRRKSIWRGGREPGRNRLSTVYEDSAGSTSGEIYGSGDDDRF